MKKNFFDKSLFKITSSVGTVSLFSLTIPLMFENIMNRLIITVVGKSGDILQEDILAH